MPATRGSADILRFVDFTAGNPHPQRIRHFPVTSGNDAIGIMITPMDFSVELSAELFENKSLGSIRRSAAWTVDICCSASDVI